MESVLVCLIVVEIDLGQLGPFWGGHKWLMAWHGRFECLTKGTQKCINLTVRNTKQMKKRTGKNQSVSDSARYFLTFCFQTRRMLSETLAWFALLMQFSCTINLGVIMNFTSSYC